VSTRLMRVEVETKGEWTMGQTVCDIYGKFGREPNVLVGFDLQVERFWDMTIHALTTY